MITAKKYGLKAVFRQETAATALFQQTRIPPAATPPTGQEGRKRRGD
jgi:hypothetical protein